MKKMKITLLAKPDVHGEFGIRVLKGEGADLYYVERSRFPLLAGLGASGMGTPLEVQISERRYITAVRRAVP